MRVLVGGAEAVVEEEGMESIEMMAMVVVTKEVEGTMVVRLAVRPGENTILSGWRLVVRSPVQMVGRSTLIKALVTSIIIISTRIKRNGRNLPSGRMLLDCCPGWQLSLFQIGDTVERQRMQKIVLMTDKDNLVIPIVSC